MKYLLKIALLFWIVAGSAQTKLELTPKGFLPLEMAMPNHPNDELIQMSKDWAYSHYFVKGCDIFGVTANSLTIEAPYENAYYYRNLGVEYNFDIKYTLKIVFGDNQKYTLTFTVKEISINNNPIKTTVTDFFTSQGMLKDAFKEAKPSLEVSVNKIIKSYTKYLAQ